MESTSSLAGTFPDIGTEWSSTPAGAMRQQHLTSPLPMTRAMPLSPPPRPTIGLGDP